MNGPHGMPHGAYDPHGSHLYGHCQSHPGAMMGHHHHHQESLHETYVPSDMQVSRVDFSTPYRLPFPQQQPAHGLGAPLRYARQHQQHLQHQQSQANVPMSYLPAPSFEWLQHQHHLMSYPRAYAGAVESDMSQVPHAGPQDMMHHTVSTTPRGAHTTEAYHWIAQRGDSIGLQMAYQYQAGPYHVDNTAWQTSLLPPQADFAYAFQQDFKGDVLRQDFVASEQTCDYPAWASAEPVFEAPVGMSYSMQGASKALNMSSQDMTKVVYEDNDHPSFAKPPHRASSSSRAAGNAAVAHAPYLAADPGMPSADAEMLQGPEVIAPDASAIPAPPSIEKSAYPLAALATQLVWDAFIASSQTGDIPAIESSPVRPGFSTPGNASPVSLRGRNLYIDNSAIYGRMGSQTGTAASSAVCTPQSARMYTSASASPYVRRADGPRGSMQGLDTLSSQSRGAYGAIGGERKPSRMHKDYSPSSDDSSPASSAPGTPNHDVVATGWNQMAGASIVYGVDDEASSMLPYVFGKEGTPLLHPSVTGQPTTVHHQIRSGNSAPQLPPMALYDQIQKFLAATLLSPQVLLLALHLISKLPYSSVLYPPATSPSALKSTSAPFKLLIAALVVANKHLDDNSFRSSTFAQVSNINLNEINALEYSLLSGLSFNVNIETAVWLQWLHKLEYSQPPVFTSDQVSVASIITPMIEGVYAQQQELDMSRRLGKHPVTLSCALLTASSKVEGTHTRTPQRTSAARNQIWSPQSPGSDGSVTDAFDLDAAGPLEQRPRYSAHLPQNPAMLPIFTGHPTQPYHRFHVPLVA